MRIRSVLVVAAVAAAVQAGCVSSNDGGAPPTSGPASAVPPQTLTALAPGDYSFAPPVVIDASRPGGEPVIHVTRAGSLIVAAHPGPTHSSPTVGDPDPAILTYSGENPMWRSTDGGASWSYVGFSSLAQLGIGPRDTSFSISDPDLTHDEAGTLYHVSLYNPGEAQVGLGMSRSTDDGQTWEASPVEPGGDRPWISARGPDDVFVAVHGSIYRSVPGSGGIKLQNVGHSPYSQPDTNLQVGPDGKLYHGGYTGIAKSTDDGATWIEMPMNRSADASSPGWQMGEPVFDAAGNLYATWFVDNAIHYGIWAPDAVTGELGAVWVYDWTVADLPGTHVWPWMVAGDEGRIAIVWLGSLDAATPETESGWHVYAAFVENASTPAPKFSIVDATPTPIHQGVLCQSGVGCAALSDRRLGDFFTATVLPDGNLGIAVAATVIPGDEDATDGWWGRPIFVKQEAGPLLRTDPDATDATAG